MRLYRLILGMCLTLIILVLPLSIFLYGIFIKQWESPGLRRIVGVIPIPAARVGSRWVSYSDYLEHVDAERKFLSSQASRDQSAPQLTDLQIRRDALERAIHIVAIEDYATQRNVIITPLDVDRVYDTMRQQAGTSTTAEEFRKILSDQFGWSDQEVKRYFIRPALLEESLVNKKKEETGDENGFQTEIRERLQHTDVIRYIRIT